jgi:hypothetical protein
VSAGPVPDGTTRALCEAIARALRDCKPTIGPGNARVYRQWLGDVDAIATTLVAHMGVNEAAWRLAAGDD